MLAEAQIKDVVITADEMFDVTFRNTVSGNVTEFINTTTF